MRNILNQIFGNQIEIFYSVDIESGSVWLDRINRALEEAKIGIIVLTKKSIKKPWVNFEAGEIFKADTKNTYIISIYVDNSAKPHLNAGKHKAKSFFIALPYPVHIPKRFPNFTRSRAKSEVPL